MPHAALRRIVLEPGIGWTESMALGRRLNHPTNSPKLKWIGAKVRQPANSPATVRTDLPRKHAAKQKPGDDPAFVFVVAKSQARKTRVIDPATYPRILFPDNSLPANSKSFRRRYDDYRDEFCAGVKSESR